MPSIDELRGNVEQTIEFLNRLRYLTAPSRTDEVINFFNMWSGGSDQGNIREARHAMWEMKQQLADATSAIDAAVEALRQYSARL